MAHLLATEEIQDHDRYLQDHMDSLVDSIELRNSRLWDHLVANQLFSAADVRYIKETHSTNRDQVRALLDRIRQQPLENFRKFQQVLQRELGPHWRKKRVILNQERLKAITENEECLKETILIEGSGLLEKLVQENVLTEENMYYIKDGGSNSQKVERLLTMMQKKSDRDYVTLCDCLWADKQKDVVSTYLSTPVDFFMAKQTVIKYIEKEFRDIHMYTADGSSLPVPMDKIYVNVTWQRVSNKLGGSLGKNETEYLESPLDIFSKMQNYEDSRTTISGVAGSGKTSFMKHISQKWIEAHRNRFLISEQSPLRFYIILIPIILRLIRTGMSLTDVIKDQIPSISFLEACSICKAMATLQKNVLIILDGYDELLAHNMIDPIIKKNEFAQVSIIVTTRPHGITLLKSLGSRAVEQLLYIYGFSKEQIETYINLFFDFHGKNAGMEKSLINELLEKETYLSEMARIPIQLEILCIVWNVKQKLGNNILDLYQSFIECLAFHMERKGDTKYGLKDILPCFCKLANSWTEHGSLEKIFPHKKLSEEFSTQLEGMIKFGCLVKYHPSTHLDTSYWSFSHLTLQEYFLAMGICQMPFEEDKVRNMFSSVPKLERLEMVLKFISGMNPSLADKILLPVLNSTTDKEECKRLLDIIVKLIPEYKSKDKINLVLPRYVAIDKIESTTSKNWTIDALTLLSWSDRQPKHRNMKLLSLSSKAVKCLSEQPQILDISYVHELQLHVGDEQVKGDSYEYILKNAKMIQKLEISNIDEYFPSHALNNILSEELAYTSLHGKSVISKAVELLNSQKRLEVLHLQQTEELNQTEFQEFCTKFNSGAYIEIVCLDMPSLHPTLLYLQSTVKVTVGTLTKESLATFVDIIKESKHGIANITELEVDYIAENDTEEDDRQGLMLGHLLCYLSKLSKLSLCGDDNTFLNMESLVEQVEDNKGIFSLLCLSIKCITKPLWLNWLSLEKMNLEGTGAALGELVSHCPNLHTLNLYCCCLTVDDVEEMADNIWGSTSITSLSLAWNGELMGGETAVCHLLQHTPNLQVLDLYLCRLQIPALMQSASTEVFSKLRVLDLKANYDKKVEVGSYLASMPHLQALGMGSCQLPHDLGLKLLFMSLPPNLTHLDVCANTPNVIKVLEHKERLAQLHRLNIGSDNMDEVEAIKEELQQLNPEMLVYHDMHESLWKMYRDS